MSLQDCITRALKEGKITPEQADRLRQSYDDTLDELQLDYGAHAGDEAARRVVEMLAFDLREARRRKLLQAKVAGDLAKAQDGFVNLRGEADPGEFLVNVVEDLQGKAGRSTVVQRYGAVRGHAHAMMTDAIKTFERDVWLRTRNQTTLDDMVRSLFGDQRDPTATALAKAWEDTAEYLRKRFNAAGGHIGKLERWGLPQSHDPVAVARAGYTSWRDDILPRLDRQRMVNQATGRVLTNGELEIALREVYETITTRGSSKILPSGAPLGKSLANYRADHRFLHFRNADDWLAYQSRFGNGDAFGAMMSHIDSMARDIAAMEILGPNPRSTLEYLRQRAMKWAAEMDAKQPDRLIKRADSQRAKAFQADAMFGIFDMTLMHPVNSTVARGMRTVRNLLTAAQLQSAALSSVTDIWSQKHARAYNGLPVARSFRDTFALMMPDAKNKDAAIRLGFIADGASQVALAQSRYLTEIDYTGWSTKVVDFTLRATGLSPWTQAGRWTFGMEFAGALGERVGKSLDALAKGDGADQAFARTLRHYGLDGAWDELRATPLYEPQSGARFLRPEDVASRADLPAGRAQYLADRMLEMIQSETQFAVPSASLRARAITLGTTQPGTIAGELMRSTVMYKSFTGTITYQIGTRTMVAAAEATAQGQNGRRAGVMMAGQLALGLTLFGALSMQLRELRDGRDPINMTQAKFWQAAMLQGGGLGIFGDFAFADLNRFGGGLSQTSAGPVVGLIGDTNNLVFGNMQQALSGEDTRFGREAIRYVKRYAPFSQFWYYRAAVDRMLYDQMQRMVDEDADATFRRAMQSQKRNKGNDFWWPEGAPLPARTPRLEAAAGIGDDP